MANANRSETGKSQLVKGSLQYLWEEVKTMNKGKMKALGRIISGYVKMKYKDDKANRPRR